MITSKPLTIRNSNLKLNFWTVVLLSFIVSTTLLLLERMLGIGWDFHPDSITYATESTNTYLAILENWPQIFNNSFYVVVHLLGESVFLVTFMNMLFFSLTNGLIYDFFKSKSNYKISTALALLILLNPYRIHLSTTMLKDTLIIFFLILQLKDGFLIRIISFISMFSLRIASPLYLIILIPRKLIFHAFFIFLILIIFFWDYGIDKLLELNAMELQLREFDKIPTFQEFGLWGALLRGITWSFFAFSGTFPLVNLSVPFIPVAFGSLMTLVFLKLVTGSYKVSAQLLIASFLIGLMITGFTAYIRYIYPILILWPLLMVSRSD